MGRFPAHHISKKRKNKHYGVNHTIPEYNSPVKYSIFPSLFFLCSNPEEPEAAEWVEEEEEVMNKVDK